MRCRHLRYAQPTPAADADAGWLPLMMLYLLRLMPVLSQSFLASHDGYR